MADVLLIDHSPTALNVVGRHLRELGLSTAVARDATTGLGLFLDLLPALTLVDWMIPGSDGLAVLRRIRTWVPTAPVAILTADPDPERLARALELGAIAVLLKPVSTDDLDLVCQRLGLASHRPDHVA